jgi:hypothetical protein
LSLDLSLEGCTNTGTTLELGLDTSANAGKLGLEANNDVGRQVSISVDTSRSFAAGRCASGRSSGRLASERAEKSANHTLAGARSGSRLAAHQAAEEASTSRTTGLSATEAESAALELLRLLNGSRSSSGDECRNSESVVDHIVEIRYYRIVVVENAYRLTNVVVASQKRVWYQTKLIESLQKEGLGELTGERKID